MSIKHLGIACAAAIMASNAAVAVAQETTDPALAAPVQDDGDEGRWGLLGLLGLAGLLGLKRRDTHVTHDTRRP